LRTLTLTTSESAAFCDLSGNTNGVLINYTYDVLNRLATASGDAGFVLNPAITYAYDAAGNLDSVIYPNGSATSTPTTR
jgi:hypothetical protein